MIDSAVITIQAGKGGDGVATFRREKYIPKGGPNGGDGGDGGSIYITAEDRLTTLQDYIRLKNFKADDGMSGQGDRKHGKSAEDLHLTVPVGTIISEMQGGNWRVIADLTESGQTFCIARGGKGGIGNVHFATATHQTPYEFTKGTPGESKEIKLDVKLLADVGIIGLPNIGKSTFLSQVTNAKPKIGNYEFTTLEPQLGVVTHKGTSFVLADIPGLIEGAAEGKGIGDAFLRHAERTKVLIHFISADTPDPEKTYDVIRKELKEYSSDLAAKKEIVVISRVDLVAETGLSSELQSFINKKGAFTISITNPKSYNALLDKIIELL